MNKPSVLTLIVIYCCLIGLVIATIVAAEIALARPWNFVVTLAIAGVKMALIMTYFMHLRYSPPLTRLVACAGFFWLAILIGLSFTDFLTRGWLPWSGKL